MSDKSTSIPNLFCLPKDTIMEQDEKLIVEFFNTISDESKYRFYAFYPRMSVWILVRTGFADFKNPLKTVDDIIMLFREYMETPVKGKFNTGLDEFLGNKYGSMKLTC